MSQTVRVIPTASVNQPSIENHQKNNFVLNQKESNHKGAAHKEHDHKKNNAHEETSQLRNVMSDLNKLSRSFVNSYQSLEGHVEQLNDQLQDVNEQRSEAIEEKEKLVNEKQALADRLQNLLAILPSGVVVLDSKGRVKECNEVAISILGRPLFGVSWVEVINRAFLPQADDGHQISLKDGRKIHIETKALDTGPGQIIVLTDMTKTRQLQAQLSQQQKLTSMGNMIASLAHQIRTPLAAALLYGTHINGNQISETKKQEFSGFLVERLQFMDRQIKDMLNFVKGERKEKKPIAINDFVKELERSCHSFNHEVIFDICETKKFNREIMADSDALVGAVGNLIDNAIDASDKDSPVNVKVRINDKNKLTVSVIDHGKGIEKKYLRKLFEPFYSTKNHGNGLGLAIVNGIVLEHQGNMSVQSKLNSGSQFSIELATYSQSLKSQNIASMDNFSVLDGKLESQEAIYGY